MRPPWESHDPTSQFDSEQTAIRVGHYKWLEMKLFEFLGGFVAMAPELDIKVTLGNHCYHHAFHAELWHRRLPELGKLKPDELAVAPHSEVEALFTSFAAPGEGQRRANDTLDKLVGLYRVILPALINAYTYHRHNASRLRDAPTLRILDLCLHDDLEQWRQGEMMIQAMLTSAEAVDFAVEAQRERLKMLVEAGGLVGGGTIGGYEVT